MYASTVHFLLFLVLVTVTKVSPRPTQTSNLPLLTIISMDGFRHDYLNQKELKDTDIANFLYYIKHGVKAGHVLNIFPSVTFPNHMTLLTGQYPEVHGIVHNEFFDPYLNASFNMQNFYQNFDSKWFDNGAEPIWVTNQKRGQGRSSGSVLWPGATAPIECQQPRMIDHATLYNMSMPYNHRIDVLMDWFTDTKYSPINLGMLYFDEPDETAHKYGPLSKEVRDKIRKLDDALGYLRQKLNETGLTDKMNIIITSDHGMNQFEDHVVNLDLILDRSWYTTSGHGGMQVFMMTPRKGTSGSTHHIPS